MGSAEWNGDPWGEATAGLTKLSQDPLRNDVAKKGNLKKVKFTFLKLIEKLILT